MKHSFVEFFTAVYGYTPFRWQHELVDHIITHGLPDNIPIPTSSGKTAIMDVMVYLLAKQGFGEITGIPRRLWYVINRRLLVDDTFERALNLARQLKNPQHLAIVEVAEGLMKLSGSDLPLLVDRCRGGMVKRDRIRLNPSQCSIISSTVDMFGSKVLFRGYGISPKSRSIHAALAGVDSCVVLDEAHTAVPLSQTLDRIREINNSKYGKFHVIQMTATPNGATNNVFPRDQAILDDPILLRRYNANKPTELVEVKGGYTKHDNFGNAVLKAVTRFVKIGRKRIVVFTNRVQSVYETTQILRALVESGKLKADIVPMTSRMTPMAKDKLLEQWNPVLRTGSKVVPEIPVIVVSTQCLEVGADYSFDALVSDCAPIDSLKQRFGRLNRDGIESWSPSPAVLVLRSKEEDPIYRNSEFNTMNWLLAQSNLDFGVNAIQSKLNEIPKDDLKEMTTKSPNASLLSVEDMGILACTNPAPYRDLTPYIHGQYRFNHAIKVVFRDDLADMDPKFWLASLDIMPSSQAEQMPVLKSEFLAFLQDNGNKVDSSDVEDEFFEESKKEVKGNLEKPFVIYRDRKLTLSFDPELIEPGDVVIVPTPQEAPLRLGIFRNDPRGVPLIDVYEDAIRAWGQHEVIRYRNTKLQREDIQALHPQASTTIVEYPDRKGFIVRRVLPIPMVLPKLHGVTIPQGNQRLLQIHTETCVAYAERLAMLLLPDDMWEIIKEVLRWHDAGKVDGRFQVSKLKRKPTDLEPLAKSDDEEDSDDDTTMLPRRWRHEVVSAQLYNAVMGQRTNDLVFHLIATHHGHNRATVNYTDTEFPPLEFTGKGSLQSVSFMVSSEDRAKWQNPRHFSSKFAQNYINMNKIHGYWDLAFLETVVRAADGLASSHSEIK